MSRLSCGLTLLMLAVLPACSDSLSVTVPHPANTFYTDEAVQLTVLAAGPRRTIPYSIVDYWNVRRARGELSIGNDEPALLTPLTSLAPGFYRLLLFDGPTRNEETFCIIPRPYEDPGDYDLFGLHPGDGATEENLATASQIGVRSVRQNIPWPVFEPSRGTYDQAWLKQWCLTGRKYGVQMMFVLGFTPQFAGEKPQNALDGWVNDAWFIWHPKDPNAWAAYLKQAMGTLQGQTVPWPSTHVMPGTGRMQTRPLPLAQSWEVWNEADLMFYVGDWGRYLDLLHLTWAAGRTMLPDTPLIYGGSTGNFIAMGVTASGSARYCFDYVALHTGGDVEQALKVWYGGAQQIPWVVGAPRETVHTECYAQGRRGTIEFEQYRETPEELRRCYLTLKAWREAGFYRSGCLGGWIQSPGDMAPGTAMLIRHGDRHLDPTPLYPAFAATRKLLSDAVEVGPVNLGDKITAHVFLKHGKPMLTAWSDDGAAATLKIAPRAYEVDVFGVRRSLGTARSLRRNLDTRPVVIIGAEASYLGEAVRERYRLLSETPYGTLQTNSACTVWYARPLNDDLTELLDTTAATRLGGYVRRAADLLGSSPSKGPAAVQVAQKVCSETMKRVLSTCPAGQELPPKAADAFWRLSRLSEWLGEIADDRSAVWNNLAVAPEEVSTLTRRLAAMRTRVRAYDGDGELPCAEQLLDRAARQLPRLKQYERRGTYTAIADKVALAQLLCGVERPEVLRVVPMIDFTSSRSLRKARGLEPAQTHTLTVWVYNYLDHAVSGELRLKLPATWSPAAATVVFRAEAGQPSEPQLVTVSLPDTPHPWTRVSSFTLNGMIDVELPSSLEDRPAVEIGGQTADGTLIPSVSYWVNVGKLVPDASMTTASTKSPTAAVSPELLARRRWIEQMLTAR